MYTINQNVLQTPVAEGNILLLEPQAGFYFELNETSVLIYQYLADGLTEKGILQKLLEKYDIEESIVTKDISELIADLLENKIIMLQG